MTNRCCVMGAAIRGVVAFPIYVEVMVGPGLPGMAIVGLADASVQESKERVKAALGAAGFSMPSQKIVVNLAPSDIRKSGSGFDLPIAIGILVASGQLPTSCAAGRLFFGELSLDGVVRPVSGTLAVGICAEGAGLELVCSSGSSKVPLEHLSQAGLFHLRDLEEPLFHPLLPPKPASNQYCHDFADVAGHERAKRAFQIAAAGNHGLLMMGPPGSGKTMLASRLSSILPRLPERSALEAAVVHSVAGEDDVDQILSGLPPYRKPHHSASMAGLVGGGSSPIRPGEISLAHHGVLFLDELAEFKTTVLQGIRQPMESGQVVITRADGNVVFPARFTLVAAANPCPCGYLGDTEVSCSCTMPQIKAYQARIGGPLMDRIDLHLDVRRLKPSDVLDSGNGTTSQVLRSGVEQAREYRLWRHREKGDPISVDVHARTPADLVRTARLCDENREFLTDMAKHFAMSGRGIIRTLAVARTLADIDQRLKVSRRHIAEALTFRLRDGVGDDWNMAAATNCGEELLDGA